jgi:DNA-binding response OmpR family regulator
VAKILLAEDEKHLADMVAFKLTNSGHRVVLARDGEEALALLGRERPDLAILDIMMPGVDGLEVLRRIRDDPDLRALPVIMLTAKGQERDVLAGLGAGANDYVVKPFSLKELVARIDTVLRKG